MGQLEDERDEVDRDQEGEEELDVLPDGRVRLLDPFEGRLASEEVTVGLDRGEPFRDLGGLGRSPARDLGRSAAIVAAIWGRELFSAAAAAAARRASRL